MRARCWKREGDKSKDYNSLIRGLMAQLCAGRVRSELHGALVIFPSALVLLSLVKLRILDS